MRCLLALCAMLAFAAPAQAGTIVRTGNSIPWIYAFTAAPGERNALTVEELPDNTVRVTDGAGRPEGCTPDGPDSVVCTEFFGLEVALGDGDDSLTVAGTVWVVADGGPGDDRLQGGPAGETLTGGPGRDQLLGLGGNDTSVDGDGEPDVYDGGLGMDGVSYRSAAGPIRSTSRSAPARTATC